MKLKTFVNNFTSESVIRVLNEKGEILYEGKAETLEVLQEARIVPGSGKPQGEVAQIAVYT